MVGVDLNKVKVIFWIPMPESWSEEKKEEMHGTPHQKKPDLDNLFKALADALYGDDSSIYKIDAQKYWGDDEAAPAICTLKSYT